MTIELSDFLTFLGLILTMVASVGGAYYKLITRMDAGDREVEKTVESLTTRFDSFQQVAVKQDEITRLENYLHRTTEMMERERDRNEKRHSEIMTLLTNLIVALNGNGRKGDN